jgi:dimethylargininase
MFSRAIVREPGISIVNGLTTSDLGIPDYRKALRQHREYVLTLKECGLEVIVLPAEENYPDSTFIEDVALLTTECAIIMNPGAPSRRGETSGIRKVLSNYFQSIEEVVDPGTVEAGDIMMVGSHFYIGLSQRTNENGAGQVIDLLGKYGFTGSVVRLDKMLHLKTGLAYLEHNNLVACGEFLSRDEFKKFNILRISEHEAYAANCIWINEKVLIPSGYPLARNTIEESGYTVIEIEMSEFQKLDGGLSCLSLRF